MGKLKLAVLAGLMLAAGAARAGESLINGEALRYNYPYRCNGERIFVTRCREPDDAAYCAVVYPDRPLRNGLTVETVEQRGDVVRNLAACTAPAAARPQAAAQPGASGSSPGLGRADWKILYLDERIAGFFSPAGLRRGPGTGQVWMTDIFVQPVQIQSFSNVSIIQGLYVADCAANTTRLAAMALYDADGKLLFAAPNPEGKPSSPKPGAPSEKRLALLSGRPVQLYASKVNTDEVAGLQCLADALRTDPAQQAPAAPPRPVPATASASVRPPGLGSGEWKVLYLNPRSAAFFTDATLRRGSPVGRGWITEVFAEPSTLGELKGVGVLQVLYVADCTTNALSLHQLAGWGPDRKPLYSAANPSPTAKRVQPGTTQALELNLLCGRPVELVTDQTIPGDVAHLQDVYATQRAFARLPNKR
jgi:hypothetical protein